MGKRSTSGSFNEYFPIIEIFLDYLKDVINNIIIKEDKDKDMV